MTQLFPQSTSNSNIHPNDAHTWYRQGDALANNGKYLEALACFDRVLALQPDHDDAWVFRAVALIQLERHEDALASCEKAIAIRPSNPEAWTFRGVALHRLGQYREAYSSYDRALGVEHQSLWERLSGSFHAIKSQLSAMRSRLRVS